MVGSTWYQRYLSLALVSCSDSHSYFKHDCGQFSECIPKLKLLKNSLPYFRGQDILKLPVHHCLTLTKADEQTALISDLSVRLTKMGYKVKAEGSKLKGEYGVVGRLAPSVTHVGLLTLLLGIQLLHGQVWFQCCSTKLNFSDSQHSKL
jgi:cytochrome c biogenesis protein ResB